MAGLWYRTGTVDVTQGSKRVVGTNTTWKTAINHPDKGNGFYGPDGKAYEIDYVTSDTELYLVDIYAGANASAQSYKIDVRGGTVPELSRQLSAHYAYMQGVIDSLQAVVNGAGDVELTAPDGQKVTVPSLSNMLSKNSLVEKPNGAGLADIKGKIPRFSNSADGLLEVGSTIDFHSIDDPSSDFTVRFAVNGANTLSVSSYSLNGVDVQVAGAVSATNMYCANQGSAGNAVAQKMYVDRLRIDAAAAYFPISGGRILGSTEVIGYLVKLGFGDFVIRDKNAAGSALHPDARQTHFYNIDGTLTIRSDMNSDSDRIGNVCVQAYDINIDAARSTNILRPNLQDTTGATVLQTIHGAVLINKQLTYNGMLYPYDTSSVLNNPGAHAQLVYRDDQGNNYGMALLQIIPGDSKTYGTAIFTSNEDNRYVMFSKAKVKNPVAPADFETHCWINAATGQINTDGDVISSSGLIGFAAYVNGVQQASPNALTRKDYVDSRTTSDARLKRDFELIATALDKVELLRGLTFTKTDYSLGTESRMAGVIAQEVEAVLPEAVSEIDGSDDGIKIVDPLALCGLLVEAIKELRHEVDGLRKEFGSDKENDNTAPYSETNEAVAEPATANLS